MIKKQTEWKCPENNENRPDGCVRKIMKTDRMDVSEKIMKIMKINWMKVGE